MIDFCPYCQKQQQLIGSSIFLKKKDAKGKSVKTEVVSYVCSGCRNFVKSDTKTKENKN